jgi:TolB protein
MTLPITPNTRAHQQHCVIRNPIRRICALLPARGIRMPALFLALLLTTALQVRAQQEIVIDKTATATRVIPIALNGFTGEVASALKFDLEVLGFEIVDSSKAQYNVTGTTAAHVEGRLIDQVTKASLFAKRYNASTRRAETHALANDIVSQLRQIPGIAHTKIAFKGQTGAQTEIYVADYDGSNAMPITSDGALVAAPGWGPNGRTLAYTSYRSGYPDIYVQDLSGKREIIAKYPGLNTSAAVSPDGKWMAMILSKDGSPDLYVSRIDGSNLKRLTKTRAVDASPCWSPDGKTICFVSDSRGASGLFLISPDGSGMRKLRTVGSGKPTEPDWSPDGSQIVFTSQWRQFVICVVPAAGGEVTTLVDGEDPSWAPNSRTVIFSKRKQGRRLLSLLDVPTKRIKDIPQSLAGSSQPSWAK